MSGFRVYVVVLCLTLQQCGVSSSTVVLNKFMNVITRQALLSKGDDECSFDLDEVEKEKLQELLESKPKFIEYEIKKVGDYTIRQPPGLYWTRYKKTRLFRTTGSRGPHTLSGIYSITPFDALNWLMPQLSLKLKDEPRGCAANMTSAQLQAEVIRLVLRDFDLNLAQKNDETRPHSADVWGCIELLSRSRKRWMACCKKGTKPEYHPCIVTRLVSQLATKVQIGIIVISFLLGPVLIPDWACRKTLDYVHHLRKPLRKSIWITRSKNAPENLTVTNALDLRRVRDPDTFKKCRYISSQLPTDTRLNVAVNCYNIQVDDTKIVTKKKSPVNVLQSVVNTLFLWHFTRTQSYSHESADKNVHKCSAVGKAFGRMLLAVLIPAPCYTCLVLYYTVTYPELQDQKRSMKNISRTVPDKDLYLEQANKAVLMALGLFLTTIFSIVCLRNTAVYVSTLKSITSALIDMRTVTILTNLKRATSVRLFRRNGKLGIIFGLAVAPLVAVACLLHRLPFVFLCWRIVCHVFARKRLSGGCTDSHCGYKRPRKRLANFCLHLLAVINFLVMFCSLMLLFAYVTVTTAKIMWMCALLLVLNDNIHVAGLVAIVAHAFDCYGSVYRKYAALSKAIFKELESRLPDNYEFATLNHVDNEINLTFKIDGGISDPDEITMGEINGIVKHQWNIANLLFFVDKSGYSAMPRKFFDKFCQMRSANGVGTPLKSMAVATMSFACRIIFVIVIILMIDTIGNSFGGTKKVQQIGGLMASLIPLVRKLYNKKAYEFGSSVCFKRTANEMVNNYRETWPIVDLEFEIESTRKDCGPRVEKETVDLLILISDDRLQKRRYRRVPYNYYGNAVNL